MTKVMPRPSLVIFLVLVLVVLVYYPGLSGGFIFDDYPNLVLDPDWKMRSLGWQEFQSAILNGISSPAGRPLALLSFGLTHLFFEMAPWAYKAGNLLLHLINGVLIVALLRKILPLLGIGLNNSTWAAIAVASLWLLHPLQVSTVLYVVQRMEVGAATGVLIALLGYVQLRWLQIEGRPGCWRWMVVVIIGVLFGLGFKETAALVPAFAFLLEITIFRFRIDGSKLSRSWVVVYGIGILLAALIYLRLMAPFFSPGSLYEIRDFGPWERLLTQPRMLMMYLGQILLPRPDSYTFYYDYIQPSRGIFAPPSGFWSLLAVAALIGLAVFFRKRQPIVALGTGWFFIAHLLTSNFVPLELAFEHRNYLAILGVLLALLPMVGALLARLHADACLTLSVIVLIGVACLTMAQTATWGRPLQLAWTLENRAPLSARASYSLGKALLEQVGDDDKNPAWFLALRTFEHAQALDSASPLAAQGVILMKARTGRVIEPGVWARFRELLTVRKVTPEALAAVHAVTNCRISGVCRLDDGQLLLTLLAVLESNPDNSAIHTIYANYAWNTLSDKALAIRLQRRAVELSDDSASSKAALLKFLSASPVQSDQDEARRLLRQQDSGVQ